MTQVDKLDPALGHMHLHETFSLSKFKLILNGKCGVINSGLVLALQHLFESDLNNGPSPSHPSLVSDGIFIHLFRSPTYGFLVGAMSAQGLQA